MQHHDKCIFCGKTESEFDLNNKFTEEHIIPQSLGNDLLKTNRVCKKCNSGLGAYVDSYFVNSRLLQMIKIAYEYAMICLGDAYWNDPINRFENNQLFSDSGI